jgi:hypothetical protein
MVDAAVLAAAGGGHVERHADGQQMRPAACCCRQAAAAVLQAKGAPFPGDSSSHNTFTSHLSDIRVLGTATPSGLQRSRRSPTHTEPGHQQGHCIDMG